jgi:hypothetical protein
VARIAASATGLTDAWRILRGLPIRGRRAPSARGRLGAIDVVLAQVTFSG